MKTSDNFVKNNNIELFKLALMKWIELLNTDGVNSKQIVRDQMKAYLKMLNELEKK
jgi:hypothetical protein